VRAVVVGLAIITSKGHFKRRQRPRAVRHSVGLGEWEERDDENMHLSTDEAGEAIRSLRGRVGGTVGSRTRGDDSVVFMESAVLRQLRLVTLLLLRSYGRGGSTVSSHARAALLLHQVRLVSVLSLRKQPLVADQLALSVFSPGDCTTYSSCRCNDPPPHVAAFVDCCPW
jgi:hypothetical protein